MTLVYPVTDPEFLGGELCNGCGCRWDMDMFDEPNPQHEACEGGCPCHEWSTVESRAQARHEEQLEDAWRIAGYRDSMAVWQSEMR